MDDTPQSTPITGLTVEIAQAIFPIARSDRRKHGDLFLDVIPEDRLRDDAAFYDGLLRIIASGDYARLRRYDERMSRSGDHTKSFGVRAQRWLVNQSAGDLTFEDIPGLPPEHFPLGTPERAVHRLFFGLFEPKPSEPTSAPTEDAPPEAPEARDWAALARELAEGAQALERPEIDAAEHLVALAEALAAACRGAAEAEGERRTLAARTAALCERLAALGLELAATLTEAITAEGLDRLEDALAGAEAAHMMLAEAESALEIAVAAVGVAWAARDFARLSDLSPRAAQAAAEAEAARNARDAAIAGLRASLQAKEGGDAAGESALSAPRLPAPGPEDAQQEPNRAAPAGSSPAPAAVAPDEPKPAPDDTLAPQPAAPQPARPAAAEPEPRPAPEPLTVGAAAPAPEALRIAAPVAPERPHFPTSADPAALLADYLEAGEIAFAWHLARLVRVPVPAPILRSLAILPAIQRAEDMADPRRSDALAELAAALPEAADPVAAGRLALAAQLRPALFDPDHGARGHVNNLLGHPGLESQAPLIEALAALGYDVRLSAALLAELVGTRPRPAEPAARQRLADWLAEARHRKTVHQPTYAIFHRELHRDGALGRVVEAVLAEKPEAERLAQQLIAGLAHNRGAQEHFVSEAEQRSGRPRRDRIEGMALYWFCRGIQEACDHLSDWIRARLQDAAHTQDDSREGLLRALGPVRKALDRGVEGLAGGDGALAQAAGRVLATKLDDLRNLIEGRAATSLAPRLHDLLEAPLLRLPGGCQDWTEDGDPAFAAERAARDRRLSAALTRPGCIAADDTEGFEARLSEPALLAAQRLLERPHERGGDAGELRARQQHLNEVLDAARRQARERLARLRQSLTTIGYLDLDAATALPGDLVRLTVIDAALVAPPKGSDAALPALNGVRRPDLPPDFPELDALLAEMEARRDQLRARIGERQRVALESLTAGPEGGSARELLAVFDRLDPVTVDDAIAELKAGRAVPLSVDEAPDVFARFFPGFVASLVAAPEDTARGRVLGALGAGGSAGPLELANIDERRAKRLTQLLKEWGRGEDAMQRRDPARLREALARLLGLIGFSGLRLAEGREAVPGRLRLLTLDCDVPRASNWFLPPAFGSAAGGRYRLMVARADVPFDQLLRQIGSEAPDAAWIVVLFGRLDVQERGRLARQMRAEARTALVLDETLLLFSGLESDDPFATFLTCALPFAWVQPYTTSPGQIPPEIFFGRQAEIDQIVARDGGGCLIYGGRQLGKSVLLNHIRGERHRPERGELALCLDIKPIGGPGQPADSVWQELAHHLGRSPGFERIEAQPNAVVAGIETWLGQDPARRVLAMFDEADNFLRAEHTSGYPNLQPLKGLMERTGRRFKAVFAGLHNVRRMARAPNSPLPHLGAPICIGPMNQSPENRAALRRLAVEPMRAAGLDYSDPGLASDMLARMNYYPSLVQVFGRQIVESFGRRPRAAGEGPRWRLDRDSLFEGAAAERIAEQIRDRFQLTLNLDVRYDCIARSIALHRLESVGGDTRVLAQGLTAGEIGGITHWPKMLVPPAMTDFEELLEELVDLGVLSRFPDNRYGLRNAQVAQMLGGREALEEALLRLDEREDDPAYDAALFFRSLRPKMPAARAPLSDRDLDRLFDPRVPGLRLVRAPAAVAGDDAADRILAAAELWLPAGEHSRTITEDGQLRRAIDRVKSGTAVVVIVGDWSAATAAQLAQHPKVAKGEVLPVLYTQQFTEAVEGVIAFDAGPWSEAMLRHWLADEGLAPALDDVRTRAALLAATGGAPARLETLRHSLSELGARSVTERVEDLADWAIKTPLPADALNLDDADRACLRTLHDLEDQDPSREDLALFCPEATEARLERLAAIGTLRQGRMPGAAPIPTPLGRLSIA